MDSILDSIKEMLQISKTETAFDYSVLMCINSALMSLNQLGIGPSQGFSVNNSTTTWDQFVGTALDLEGVKTYVYLKVKMLFDPPTSSFVLESMKTQATELEWRLNVQVEGGQTSE